MVNGINSRTKEFTIKSGENWILILYEAKEYQTLAKPDWIQFKHLEQNGKSLGVFNMLRKQDKKCFQIKSSYTKDLPSKLWPPYLLDIVQNVKLFNSGNFSNLQNLPKCPKFYEDWYDQERDVMENWEDFLNV